MVIKGIVYVFAYIVSGYIITPDHYPSSCRRHETPRRALHRRSWQVIGRGMRIGLLTVWRAETTLCVIHEDKGGLEISHHAICVAPVKVFEFFCVGGVKLAGIDISQQLEVNEVGA